MSLNPTTLQQMITDSRRLADMKVSQFWTDTDFTTELNKSLQELDMILINQFSDYKVTAIATQCTAGTNTIPLPADFLKLRGLDVVTAPGNADGYWAVSPFMFRDRNQKYYPYGITVYSPFSLSYRLEGSTITLLPAQIANNYTYRLWYVPDFIPLVNPTDTLQTYMDSQAWYQYAVLDTVNKCLAAQNLSEEALIAKKEEFKQMVIKLSAPQRDEGEPSFMVDTRWTDDGFGWVY